MTVREKKTGSQQEELRKWKNLGNLSSLQGHNYAQASAVHLTSPIIHPQMRVPHTLPQPDPKPQINIPIP